MMRRTGLLRLMGADDAAAAAAAAAASDADADNPDDDGAGKFGIDCLGSTKRESSTRRLHIHIFCENCAMRRR